MFLQVNDAPSLPVGGTFFFFFFFFNFPHQIVVEEERKKRTVWPGSTCGGKPWNSSLHWRILTAGRKWTDVGGGGFLLSI